MNPYQVTKDFESALCEYTGAPFAVALNSCSAALMLAVAWHLRERTTFTATANANVHFDRNNPELSQPYHFQVPYDVPIEIPRHTYVSVPMAIRLAGAIVRWRDENWRGTYQLKPTPVWDSARRFTSGMYLPGQFQCVSFATTKILGIEQGGAILHDNPQADAWFRKARFDGRSEGVDPKDDTFDIVGYHCLMLPSIAAQLILKLHHLPRHNDDLPDYPYPDLSLHAAFR